jgi:hypothetical protein
MGCLLGGESHSRNRYVRSIYLSHGHLKPAAIAAAAAGFFWLLTGTFSDDDHIITAATSTMGGVPHQGVTARTTPQGGSPCRR